MSVGENMKNLNKYRVIMTIEGEGKAEDDKQIEKTITASTPEEALTKGRNLVKTENPELNYMKIWAWSIVQIHG
jgi:hypothetical protein